MRQHPTTLTTIKESSAVIFINNKYSECYFRIVTRAKSRILDKEVYSEVHHIIPKSFYKSNSKTGWLDGNPDTNDNLVTLTAREHFICHVLLLKMTEGLAHTKMVHAATRTGYGNEHLRGYKKLSNNSRTFQVLKEKKAQAQSELASKLNDERIKNGTHQLLKREDGSSVTKDRVDSGEHHFLKREDGSSISKDRVDSGEHHLLGPDTNIKMLTDGIHPSQQLKTCPHCGITVSSGPYSKFHGDQCSENPSSDNKYQNIVSQQNQLLLSSGQHPSQCKVCCLLCRSVISIGNFSRHYTKCSSSIS